MTGRLADALALVEWTDASYREELADGDPADPFTLRSVGFLVEPYRGDGSRIVLAMERDEANGDWRHVTTIPGALVIRVQHLEARP